MTKDDKFVILVCSTDPVFDHLCDAMERPDWLPKYAKAKDRLTDAEPIMKGRHRMGARAHIRRAYGALQRIAASPISPRLQHQGHLRRSAGTQARHNNAALDCVFPVLSETPGKIKWPGQKIGAQNEDVYHGLLGLSDEEIAKLKEQKVI